MLLQRPFNFDPETCEAEAGSFPISEGSFDQGKHGMLVKTSPPYMRLLPRTDLLPSPRHSPICVPLSVLVISGRRPLLLNSPVRHVKMALQSGVVV
jgi:hypothetical protein